MTSSTDRSAFLEAFRTADFPEGTLQVMQITDTHLYQDHAKTLLGVNTFESFNNIIDLIKAADWPLDLILATGDLVHDASPQGYSALSDLLNNFSVPVYCLPGNHDVPDVMKQHLAKDKVTTPNWVDQKNWRFILLDSVIADGEGGHLAAEQLDILDQALQETPANVMICLHHQPVPVGSRWLDTMQVNNAEQLWQRIEAHSEVVKCVLWGHVHQDFEGFKDSIKLIATPSTCMQFTPKKDDFEVDQQAPGLRLLALLPDGQIETAVIRLDTLPQGLDVNSAGY